MGGRGSMYNNDDLEMLKTAAAIDYLNKLDEIEKTAVSMDWVANKLSPGVTRAYDAMLSSRYVKAMEQLSPNVKKQVPAFFKATVGNRMEDLLGSGGRAVRKWGKEGANDLIPKIMDETFNRHKRYGRYMKALMGVK